MSKPMFKHVIEGARACVARRGSWTRFMLAATSRAEECDPTDPRARRFCAYGALVRAAHDLTGDPEAAGELAGRAAIWITGCETAEEAFGRIATINDGAPFAARQEILRLFDEGLARV